MTEDTEWIPLNNAALRLGVTMSQMRFYAEQMDLRQIDGQVWVMVAHVDALSTKLGVENKQQHKLVTVDDTEWISIHEAAKRVGLTDKQMRYYAKQMDRYRIGSRIFVKAIDVQGLKEELEAATVYQDQGEYFVKVTPAKPKKPSQIYLKPQPGAYVTAVYKQGALNDQTHLTKGDGLTLCGETIPRGTQTTLMLDYQKCRVCLKHARTLKLLCKGCSQPLIRRPRDGMCYSCWWRCNQLD